MQIEALEAQAATAPVDFLPDTAGPDAVVRHGGVEGVAREPASAAVVTVVITSGPVSSSAALTGQTLQSPAGLSYLPVDTNGNVLSTLGPTDGSGGVTILARCTTTGVAGNVAVGAVLTWSSAPTGFATAANTVSAVTVGDDIEDIELYRAKIIARRQNRPGSGNREDWKEWAELCAHATQAWVYPLLSPAGTPGTLGCVTVVVTGDVQGASITNTRIVAGSVATAVAAFIEGTGDANGNAVTNGIQLRPATIATADYTVVAATPSAVDVDLTLVNNGANAFPFVTSYAKVTSTTTQVVLTGDQTATFIANRSILLYLGAAYARGGYVQVLVASSSYNGGTVQTTVTFAAVANAPANNGAGKCVYPAPANYSAVRDVIFAHFDALGPGDTTPPSRYPAETVTARATLYKQGLLAAVVAGAAGVLSATTTLADTTPAAKAIVTLGELLVHQ